MGPWLRGATMKAMANLARAAGEGMFVRRRLEELTVVLLLLLSKGMLDLT